MTIYMTIYITPKWGLKWGTIAFSPWFTPITTPPSIIPTTSVESHFRMDLMTCMKNFPSVWKNPKTVPWSRGLGTWWKWWIEVENLMKIHHSVHPQRTVFGFFHTDEKFSLHVIRFIRKWHSTMIVRGWFIEKGGRADFILTKSPTPQFTIFTKSSTPPIRGPFSDFFIQMENFSCMNQVHTKMTLNADRRYYREWCDDRDRELDENQVCKACFAITWSTLLVHIHLKYWVLMIR
jgi:hypothetical protein